MSRIAFLGPEGTVSQEALQHHFAGQTHTYIPYRLISDVITAANENEVDVGFIPVENTIEGSVKDSMDMLVHDVELPIWAEWIYPSIQNLIAHGDEYRNGAEIDYSKVRKVLSKDVAIAQCRVFLKRHLPQAEMEFVGSTAEGVRLVKENPGQGLAAIGTKLSAGVYGLDVIGENITDHNNNFTRFLMVGHNPPPMQASTHMKTTILVTLPEDYPGALHQVLSAFAWRRINLSRIESRPTRQKLGSYYFYIDIEGSLESVLLPGAIAEVEAIGCQVRILGSYPCYSYHFGQAEV
jgi:prephenate dehydratase